MHRSKCGYMIGREIERDTKVEVRVDKRENDINITVCLDTREQEKHI